MFQRATTGSLKNNGKLSDCSKDNISHILDQIFNGRRDNCFHGMQQLFIYYADSNACYTSHV